MSSRTVPPPGFRLDPLRIPRLASRVGSRPVSHWDTSCAPPGPQCLDRGVSRVPSPGPPLAGRDAMLEPRRPFSGLRFREAFGCPLTLGLCAFMILVHAVLTRNTNGDLDAATRQLSFLHLSAGTAEPLWMTGVSQLLHRNWDHLTGNVGWLLFAGIPIERRIGTRRYAIFLVIAYVVGFVLQACTPASGVGASGLLYAVIGLSLTLPFAERRESRGLPRFGWLVLLLSTWYILGDSPDSIELDAPCHILGLVTGLIAGAFLDPRAGTWANFRKSRARLAVCSIATLAFLVAIAPQRQWEPRWQSMAALAAERRGDIAEAERQWAAFVRTSDPSSSFDASAMEEMARYHMRRGDRRGARDILDEIAPVLGQTRLYRSSGMLWHGCLPKSDSIAFERWARALELGKERPQLLDLMARVALFPADSNDYFPERARALAWCAVNEDEFRSPVYLYTLALATYLCGEPRRGLHWLCEAIARNPDPPPAYFNNLKIFEHEVVLADSAQAAAANSGSSDPAAGVSPIAARASP